METKTTILDAAERLFAESGIAATSLRQITAAAGVNLAAVHYHFGSKDALVQAVFSRRIDPLNRERLARLDGAEAAAGDGPLSLDDLLRAFLEPVLRLGLDPAGGERFKRLLGRMYTEPGPLVGDILSEQFGHVARRFVPAFRRALPDLPADELFWRIHFTIGAMAQTCADTHRLELISDGLCDAADVDGTVEKLVRFLVAGLGAPAPDVSATSEGERHES